MAVMRMDNVAIVVEDLEHAIAFFEALGLSLEGRTTVQGPWVDGCVGLTGVVSHIAVLGTPDGHGRVELARYEQPTAVTAPAPAANTVGLTRIMFAVDDIDATLGRLRPLGGVVLDEVVTYADAYRLCYLRGPSGIIVALAQELT